ncbi:MAG: DNA-protecting protein DprA [Bacteroidetes bacterium]|nr:DNA-protecting protein DprA [Bacteroidota bacterium]MBL6943441.1 DNA-protecting protein DprA [Bacteroidales bacterium]
MADELLKYQIALTLIPGIGDVVGKKLIAYCGGVEAVFKENRNALLKIPGIGNKTVNNILSQKVLLKAETEISFIKKKNIQPLFYTDNDYPARLLNCEDGPLLLYYKGTADLNQPRVIGFVGTRKATNEGRLICERFIDGLKTKDILVVSGLAYGIDSCAHKAALDAGLQTVGVLGHGLDRIYPTQNKKLATTMLDNGGLVTEFMSKTMPDRENFPKRNRIVAGMCDAIVIVESAKKGGALITAGLANSYNRDVFAVPGRLNDEYSQGCNMLIKSNRAALAESAADIAYIMGWDNLKVDVKKQRDLFLQLTEEQKLLFDLINEAKEISVDKIVVRSALPVSKVAAALLTLEFEGLVMCLPGKLYKTY